MKNIENNLLGINSWNDFFSHANSLTEKNKGSLFEKLTYLMLTTRPEYCSILKNVWLQGEQMPKKIREKINLPSTDVGIDLIAETIRGEYWAIQCKFKGQNQSPTYKELSTFTYLANTYCKNISLALLVHTGEKGVRRKSLLGEKYTEIGLDFWLNLAEEDWTRIHKKLKKQSVKPSPRKPRPHQEKAIDSARKHFLELKEKRGRLIMPCGTGKSLTAFWISDTIKAKSVIVVVPSLSLIKQSLEDWTKEFIAINENPRPEWLVICSDESTGKLDKDEFVSDTYSLGIPTTTSVDIITTFLKDKHKGRKIIFTTYQSSDRLAQAAKKCRFKFDLAIFDESHKTVGEKSKSFATLLSDVNISIDKRMFMTATERVVKDQGDDVYSMNDERIYGKQFYQLTFKEAIHSIPQIICDYKILTITVSNQEIQQLVTRNKLITDKSKKLEEQESQSIAAAIALRKATRSYGIRHAISFHKSIKTAEDFKELNNKLNLAKLDGIKLSSSHISSKKSAGERVQLMNNFANEKLALITNARCLTEGVDVPAIDCVLFADPKQSVVDIVQAAGRALRPYKGKKFGYVMMPLIVPDEMDFEEFAETTPFRQIAKIITALSTQDERIAEEFRVSVTGKKPSGKRILIDGTIPIGLKIDFGELAKKINTKIWEKVGRVNWRPFQEARDFIRSKNINSAMQWNTFCLSGEKPFDIPTHPHFIYKNSGWKGWGYWLGTGNVSNSVKSNQFKSFIEAREFVHSLKLKNNNEWRLYCKSANKPFDIPSNPNNVYKNSGWLNYGDWLGTGIVANSLREYMPFNEAREFIRILNIKNQSGWKDACKSGMIPDNIPFAPDQFYKSKGWINLGDWLGTGTIAPRLIAYRSFKEGRLFAIKLKLKSVNEWREFAKTPKKPKDIPANPYQTYLDKGWKNWGDWLGTGSLTPRKLTRQFKDEKVIASNYVREYRFFEQAREFVHSLNLKGESDWREYSKSGNKPPDIPSHLNAVYKNFGWRNMGDWLGIGVIATQLRKYRSFDKAREFVHSLNLKKQKDWRLFCTSGNKPNDIPANPNNIYKESGWISYGDWIGTGTVSSRSRVYISFTEARNYTHSFNFKKREDWERFCKAGNKPINIPSHPRIIYKNKGWKGWADWLGKK